MEWTETADKLFSRMRVKPLKTGLKLFDTEPNNGLRPGNVFELSGASATGKSNILLQVASTCILPSSWHGVSLGNECGVVLYDLDYSFDVIHLTAMLEHKIQTAFMTARKPSPPSESWGPIIEKSLQRLHVIRCKDSFEFCVSLRSLPTLLQRVEVGVKVVLVDSISAFFWLDKHEEEVGKARQFRLVQLLQHVQSEFNFSLLVTKSLFFRLNSNGTTKEVMDPSWRSYVQRILLQRLPEEVPPFFYHASQGEKVNRYSLNEHGVIFA